MIKTVTLTGAEQRVDGLGGFNTVIVNRSPGMVYAAAGAGISAGAEGVIAIDSGARDGLSDTNGTVYLLGNGEVSLRGTDESVNFNKPSPTAGGSFSAVSGGADTMPVMNGITGYFVPESLNIKSGLWENCLYNTDNNIVLTGGAIEGNSLRLTPEDHGLFTALSEPNIIYAVVRLNSDYSETVNCILTKGAKNADPGFGFNFLASENHIFYSSAAYDIYSDQDAGQYAVYSAVRENSKATFYINGVRRTSTVQSYTGNYENTFYLNYESFGGTLLDTPSDLSFIMCAFGAEPHTAEQIALNSEWLLRRYVR